ncbi:noggin-2-like [Anguilla rostrata]|uniref:noggin-2-like n=1 Tax=Anguilla rostrata TaxID=7938 RepID=UPI0030CC925E
MNGFVCSSGNVSVLFCWTFLGVFVNLPTNSLSTIPKYYKPNTETSPGRTDIESDLAFLRSRPHSLSSLLPVRPYSLSINEEDYHYSPKPKDLRPARLLRVLGSSFDPFWMSIERPAEAVRTSGGEIEEATFQGRAALPGSVGSSNSFNFSASPELSEGAARYQRKLEKEAEDLDLSHFPPEAATFIRAWLVRSATCELRYQWVNLGPVFWPPWLRHTDCEQTGSSRSCSFPSGMSCRRAQLTHIKILAWHCWGGEDGVSKVLGTDKGLAGPGMGVSGKRCIWRQVPYPVVTACKCSCK